MNHEADNFQLGSTFPALLAEEWLVQPSTMLPNVFEVFLVEQANRTFRRTLDEALRRLRDKLHTHRIMMVQRNDEGRHEVKRGIVERLLGATKVKCIRILQRLDSILTKYRTEILCVLCYLIERQSILRNSSTLAESMYGLKRSSIANNSNGRLQNELQHKERLALLLSLLPYVRHRIKDAAPNFRETQPFFWQAAKYLLTAYQIADVAFLLSYMTEKTHHSSALNYLLRHVVRRTAQTELKTSPTASTFKHLSSIDRYKNYASKLLYGVVILSYAFQFHSWYRQSFPPPIPDPPPYDKDPMAPKCPICGQWEIADPTVLTTTGLVYCHNCITRYVRIHQMCPVTKLPNPRWQRLHEPL